MCWRLLIVNKFTYYHGHKSFDFEIRVIPMRLWTLHPKYLDQKGLVAVWREGLLAQAVIRGATKGYKNHPQLTRFKAHPKPRRAIAHYLYEVSEEAKRRGYNFDESKIVSKGNSQLIQTTSGQLEFEKRHLLSKLEKRSIEDYNVLANMEQIDPHPIFQITPGEIEDWERGDK
jgi:hypothetical protein